MGILNGGYTPREGAAEIALSWLRAAYLGRTRDIETMAKTKAAQRLLRESIAKLHNQILDKSGMDGTPLDEKVE